MTATSSIPAPASPQFRFGGRTITVIRIDGQVVIGLDTAADGTPGQYCLWSLSDVMRRTAAGGVGRVIE